MRWSILAALTDGWLWLLAVLATAVLVVSPAPVWFALATGAAVLIGGATVQGSVEWNREKARRIGPGTEPARLATGAEVADAEAQRIIERARAAVARVHELGSGTTGAPGDVFSVAQVASSGAVDALNELGQQVDRLDTALGGIDPDEVNDELRRTEARLADDPRATTDLTQQRRQIAASLQSQLDAHERLSGQRVLVLTRMQSAAVDLESMAIRLAEIRALYATRHDDALTSTELRSVTEEMDGLRVSLIDANASLRESLRSLD